MMIRRGFLASTGAVALTPALARAQSLTTIRVATSPDEDCVACLYGQSSGISGARVSMSFSPQARAAAVYPRRLPAARSTLAKRVFWV